MNLDKSANRPLRVGWRKCAERIWGSMANDCVYGTVGDGCARYVAASITQRLAGNNDVAHFFQENHDDDVPFQDKLLSNSFTYDSFATTWTSYRGVATCSTHAVGDGFTSIKTPRALQFAPHSHLQGWLSHCRGTQASRQTVTGSVVGGADADALTPVSVFD